METVNAFIGKTARPTEAELAAALGSTVALWKQLVGWMAEQGAGEREWNSYSPKAGWALKLKQKKRTIAYMGPCAGCFRVAFILGDKAITAARKSDLPKSALKIIDEAPRYAEGTGVRLIVKAEKDLGAIKKLALIKMAN
jgi:hypothetical protein